MRERFALFVFLLAATVHGEQLSWVGGAGPNWSNPANWSPSKVPETGDSLGISRPAAMVNDLPGTTILRSVEFGDRDASLSGNPVVVSDTVRLANHQNAGFDVIAAGDIWLSLGQSTFNGSVDVNGRSVSINGIGDVNGPIHGSGTLRIFESSAITIRGGGTFSGPMSMERWTRVTLECDLPGAAVTLHEAFTMAIMTTLSGAGRLGSISGNGVYAPNPVFETSNLDLEGARWVGFRLPATRIVVDGAVSLGNSTLGVEFASGFTPASGEVIGLIENDGSDPVDGHFRNLPEGGIVTIGAHSFRITYVGGDGNDVELIEGTTCSYSVSPSTVTLPVEGNQNLKIDVTATAGCSWKTMSNATWIASNPTFDRGIGNGFAYLHVGSNTGPNRTGTVSFGDALVTIEQAGCMGVRPVALTPRHNQVVESPVRFEFIPAPGAINHRIMLIEGNQPPRELSSPHAALLPGSYTWYVIADFVICDPLESERFRFSVTGPPSRRRAARH